MSLSKKQKICIIGPLLGTNKGWVMSQGELLARKLEQEGYDVITASVIVNPILRLLDSLMTVFFRRNDFNLVIIMVFSGKGFFIVDQVSRMVKLIKKPVIFWLHGGNLPTFYRNNKDLARKTFARAKNLVAPSDYLGSFFKKEGLDIKIIPNILEEDFYPYCEREKIKPCFLWMRTFHEIYNPIMAIDAFAKIIKVFPGATLSMAGQDKGLLKKVKEVVKKKRLDSSVTFIGFLDKEGKTREFSKHDIFLNTNCIDNTPVSLLEAAAFGLIIISTNVGGIPYLLENEKEALLIDDGDVDAMVAAAERLIKEDKLAQHLAFNARKVSEKSHWSKLKPLWDNLLET